MRRWLVLFFAVLLPLQFGWSAASAYCQHEAGTPLARHFGHHFHVHEGDVPADGEGVAKAAGGIQLLADADCAACHAATPALVSGTALRFLVSASARGPAPIPPRFSSAPARAPDRPQWARLV